MDSISLVAERIAKMLMDCNEYVNAAYWLTQPAIDEIEKPCFLVFPEDASYVYETIDQEQYSQGFSIAYIGQTYSGLADANLSSEYELMARQIADSAVLYFIERQQLQFSDVRGLNGGKLPALAGVTMVKIDNRSSVSLFSRDGVSGSDGFWGFTLDLTVTQQLIYEALP